jgi:16S rRNA (guanine966-N2)-methyltransferase
MAANEIRIIGGKWKRRKLRFHPAPDLRPTLGRVRETMANWLRFELPDASVLDLFAGSGALGLEALSRGANHATFVETNKRQAQNLTQAMVELDASAVVVNSGAQQYLQANAEKRWDVIFLDPPFAGTLLSDILPLLSDAAHLNPDGLIYYECQRGQLPDLSDWHVHRQAKAGDTEFGLLAPLIEPS